MSELSSIIATILPYALGALFSPLLLSTLLGTISPGRNPRLSSFAYLFGTIIIFIMLIYFGLFVGTGISATILGPIKVGSVMEITLGIVLIFIALKTLFYWEKPEEGGIFGFINSLQDDNNLSLILKFFYMGFVTLLASFTSSILIVLAGVTIGLSTPLYSNSILGVLILGIIALLMVEIPFIFYLVSPQNAGNTLNPFNNWITRYGDFLTLIIYLILGIFFILRGFIAFNMI